MIQRYIKCLIEHIIVGHYRLRKERLILRSDWIVHHHYAGCRWWIWLFEIIQTLSGWVKHFLISIKSNVGGRINTVVFGELLSGLIILPLNEQHTLGCSCFICGIISLIFRVDASFAFEDGDWVLKGRLLSTLWLLKPCFVTRIVHLWQRHLPFIINLYLCLQSITFPCKISGWLIICVMFFGWYVFGGDVTSGKLLQILRLIYIN